MPVETLLNKLTKPAKMPRKGSKIRKLMNALISTGVTRGEAKRMGFNTRYLSTDFRYITDEKGYYIQGIPNDDPNRLSVDGYQAKTIYRIVACQRGNGRLRRFVHRA